MYVHIKIKKKIPIYLRRTTRAHIGRKRIEHRSSVRGAEGPKFRICEKIR